MSRLAWLLRPDGDKALEVVERLEKLAKGDNPDMAEVIRRFAPMHYNQSKNGPVPAEIPGEYILSVLDGVCGDGKCLPSATLSQAMIMAEDYGNRLRRASENHRNFDKFVEHIMPEMKNRHPRQCDEELHYLARAEARRRVAVFDPRFRD